MDSSGRPPSFPLHPEPCLMTLKCCSPLSPQRMACLQESTEAFPLTALSFLLQRTMLGQWLTPSPVICVFFGLRNKKKYCFNYLFLVVVTLSRQNQLKEGRIHFGLHFESTIYPGSRKRTRQQVTWYPQSANRDTNTAAVSCS